MLRPGPRHCLVGAGAARVFASTPTTLAEPLVVPDPVGSPSSPARGRRDCPHRRCGAGRGGGDAAADGFRAEFTGWRSYVAVDERRLAKKLPRRRIRRDIVVAATCPGFRHEQLQRARHRRRDGAWGHVGKIAARLRGRTTSAISSPPAVLTPASRMVASFVAGRRRRRGHPRGSEDHARLSKAARARVRVRVRPARALGAARSRESGGSSAPCGVSAEQDGGGARDLHRLSAEADDCSRSGIDRVGARHLPGRRASSEPGRRTPRRDGWCR